MNNKVKRSVKFINKYVPHLKKYHRDRLTNKFGEMVVYVSQISTPNASEEQKQTIETLVTYILYLTEQLKENGKPNTLADQSIVDKRMNHYFEELLYALVLELCLPEELHRYNKRFFQLIYAENLPKLESIKGDKITTLRTLFQKLYDIENLLRYNLFTLDTIPVVRTIQGRT